MQHFNKILFSVLLTFSVIGLPYVSIYHATHNKQQRAKQDRWCVGGNYQFDRMGIYGVFDGHGPHAGEIDWLRDERGHVCKDEQGNLRIRKQFTSGGETVAEYLAKNLPKTILKRWHYAGSFPVNELWESFQEVNEKLKKDIKDSDECGSTAVVAVIELGKDRTIKSKLYIAHAGDSRAVLCKNGNAVRLSVDHKPNDPAEIKRIEKLPGGKDAIQYDYRGQIWRVKGSAFSQAFGDFENPYVRPSQTPSSIDIDENCDFLILATDGLWDVFKDQEAVDFVSNILENSYVSLQEKLNKAVKELVEAASNKSPSGDWRLNSDDITATLIYFNDPDKPYDPDKHKKQKQAAKDVSKAQVAQSASQQQNASDFSGGAAAANNVADQASQFEREQEQKRFAERGSALNVRDNVSIGGSEKPSDNSKPYDPFDNSDDDDEDCMRDFQGRESHSTYKPVYEHISKPKEDPTLEVSQFGLDKELEEFNESGSALGQQEFDFERDEIAHFNLTPEEIEEKFKKIEPKIEGQDNRCVVS